MPDTPCWSTPRARPTRRRSGSPPGSPATPSTCWSWWTCPSAPWTPPGPRWPGCSRAPGSLRLIFGRATPQEARRAGQAVADQLNRVVLAPDGELLPTADGGLFIPADHGAGWLRLRPAANRSATRSASPSRCGSSPPWTGPGRPAPTGSPSRSPAGCGCAAPAPAPAGELAPAGGPAAQRPLGAHRRLGCPGGPAVPLADVINVWDSILPSVRSRVRFIHFGPVAVPDGRALGQALADAFARPVTLWTGLPLGAGPPDRDDAPGWMPFVQALDYAPGSTAPPRMLGLRTPLPGAREIGTGLYEYTAAAVLEVVQCGLWMRPTTEPANGDEIRRLPAAAGYSALLYDRSTPETAERMRALAEDMLWRLEPAARPLFRIAPADDPAVAAPPGAEDAWSLPEPSTEPLLTSPGSAPRRPAHVALWAAEGAAGAAAHSTAQPASAESRGPAGAQHPALGSLGPDEQLTAGAPAASAAGPGPTAAPDQPALPRTESPTPAAAPAAGPVVAPAVTPAVTPDTALVSSGAGQDGDGTPASGPRPQPETATTATAATAGPAAGPGSGTVEPPSPAPSVPRSWPRPRTSRRHPRRRTPPCPTSPPPAVRISRPRPRNPSPSPSPSPNSRHAPSAALPLPLPRPPPAPPPTPLPSTSRRRSGPARRCPRSPASAWSPARRPAPCPRRPHRHPRPCPARPRPRACGCSRSPRRARARYRRSAASSRSGTGYGAPSARSTTRSPEASRGSCRSRPACATARGPRRTR
ncbi:hypothetical protein GXW82_14385 [Streptacidiphilus sp. 4-A2]|nr:hypothetical protein [Streptacidiphilus sp. 4-A2]